jgi:hypothetical protein
LAEVNRSLVGDDPSQRARCLNVCASYTLSVGDRGIDMNFKHKQLVILHYPVVLASLAAN